MPRALSGATAAWPTWRRGCTSAIGTPSSRLTCRLWVRERALIAWNFALWEGPVDRKRDRYEVWLHRMTDLSFGVVKRLVLSMASPEKVLSSARDLWKSDHTHGSMHGHCDGHRGTVTLADSPYVETPQGRAGIAEMLRYIMELAGARGALERHALLPTGVLEVRLRWALTRRALQP